MTLPTDFPQRLKNVLEISDTKVALFLGGKNRSRKQDDQIKVQKQRSHWKRKSKVNLWADKTEKLAERRNDEFLIQCWYTLFSQSLIIHIILYKLLQSTI